MTNATVIAFPNELDFIKTESKKGVRCPFTKSRITPLSKNKKGKSMANNKKNGNNLCTTMRMPGGLFQSYFWHVPLKLILNYFKFIIFLPHRKSNIKLILLENNRKDNKSYLVLVAS